MYITQETDYAIRIVYCLAKSGARRDARSISEEMCVSLRFALKILGKLAQGGLVSSFKGNRGGYELARSANRSTDSAMEMLDSCMHDIETIVLTRFEADGRVIL